MPAPARLPYRSRLKVAVFAEVDPRSVQDYWTAARQTRPSVAKAIRGALAAFGIPDPHPEAGAVSP